MLSATDTEWEAVAFETAEQFADLKASGKLLFNQLPLLEIDGLCLTQSNAMIQYLARKYNLYGDSPQEAVKADMCSGCIRDLAGPAVGFAFNTDPADAMSKMQAALDKFGPCLEACIEPSGFLAGTRMSYVDVIAGECLTRYLERIPGCLDDNYPRLAALQAQIVQLPGVKAYLASEKRWPPSDDAYVANVRCVLK